MPNRISDSQEMVLNFIKQMVTEKGYPPLSEKYVKGWGLNPLLLYMAT